MSSTRRLINNTLSHLSDENIKKEKLGQVALISTQAIASIIIKSRHNVFSFLIQLADNLTLQSKKFLIIEQALKDFLTLKIKEYLQDNFIENLNNTSGIMNDTIIHLFYSKLVAPNIENKSYLSLFSIKNKTSYTPYAQSLTTQKLQTSAIEFLENSLRLTELKLLYKHAGFCMLPASYNHFYAEKFFTAVKSDSSPSDMNMLNQLRSNTHDTHLQNKIESLLFQIKNIHGGIIDHRDLHKQHYPSATYALLLECNDNQKIFGALYYAAHLVLLTQNLALAKRFDISLFDLTKMRNLGLQILDVQAKKPLTPKSTYDSSATHFLKYVEGSLDGASQAQFSTPTLNDTVLAKWYLHLIMVTEHINWSYSYPDDILLTAPEISELLLSFCKTQTKNDSQENLFQWQQTLIYNTQKSFCDAYDTGESQEFKATPNSKFAIVETILQRNAKTEKQKPCTLI